MVDKIPSVGGVIFFNPSIDDLKNTIKNSFFFNIFIIVWNSVPIDFEKYIDGNNNNLKTRYVFIENNRNLGVGYGLNQAMKWCSENNLKFLLALDQDSKIITTNSIIRETFQRIQYLKKVSCVGFDRTKIDPVQKKDDFNKTKNHNISFSEASIINYSFMQSGTIYSTDAWVKLKGMKQEYFIEGIDIEYSLKSLKYGFKLFKTNNCLLFHDAGDLKEFKFLSLKLIKYRIHNYWRLYMQYRNLTNILVNYSKYFPFWSLKAVLINLTFRLFYNLIFYKNKFLTISLILTSIIDGFFFNHYKKSKSTFFYGKYFENKLKFKIPKINEFE